MSNWFQKLSAKDAEFFDYSGLAKDQWREKSKEAHTKFDIRFDHENDDTVVTRVITIPQDFWETTDCKFNCEMRKAGGDWESPSIYFRCQVAEGYAKDLSRRDCFCVIPGKDEGNPQLVKGKRGGWVAPDQDMPKAQRDAEPEPDEKEAWKFLTKYLTDLVNEEIEEVKRERS